MPSGCGLPSPVSSVRGSERGGLTLSASCAKGVFSLNLNSGNHRYVSQSGLSGVDSNCDWEPGPWQEADQPESGISVCGTLLPWAAVLPVTYLVTCLLLEGGTKRKASHQDWLGAETGLLS